MEPGDRIGRYALVSRIGVGGMGEVWEAVLIGPAGFRKPVALKFLHQSDSGRSLVHEARLGGLLQHPNLVEVYALEEIDGRYVCAMELVRGGTLKEHLPLPPRAVVEAGLQVCAGLIHAHERIGLIHLDLKPENLLLSPGGVKVADLGIARAAGSAGDAGVHGTPGYCAPEVLANQAVDARADVYALGLVLIHLARGSPLRHPEAVDWLAPVTRRCVVADPGGRFRTMRELAEALALLPVEGPGLESAVGAEGRSGPITRTPTSAQSSATFQLDDFLPAGPPTNIAPEADAFVGRTAELGQLLTALQRPGLITVKGTGGLGKTRLARRAARAWHEQNHLPTWFVDLTPARDRTGLVRQIAATLELPLARRDGSSETVLLGHALHSRGPMLIVLDNFEQLVDCAGVVGDWVAAAPELHVLVTSREPLHLAAEQLIALQPLPVVDAVALLVDRAAARGRNIAADPALPELVRRLDGLPLALELAAGRLGLLEPRQVLDRLDQRFKLLRGSSRAASERQLTLRATLDWSWDLLTEVERAALAQLSVFAGGFTAEAAEAVWELPSSAWVLDVIDALVDRSLVHPRPDGRLDLYESTRAYAADQLSDEGAAEGRHFAWYARFGEADPVLALRTGGVGEHRQTRAELDNLLGAARRAHRAGEPAVALAIARAVWTLLELTGPYETAWELVDEVCRHPGDRPADRAAGAQLVAEVAYATGRIDQSAHQAELARAAAEEAGDPVALAMAMRQLGRTAYEQGDPSQASTWLARALELLGDQTAPLERALILTTLAVVDKQLDRLDLARSRGEQALEIHESLGALRLVASSAVSLSALERDTDRPQRARELLDRALRLARKVGDQRTESVAMGNLGVLALDAGRLPQAEALLLQTLDLRRELGDRRGVGVLLGTLGQIYSDMDRDAQAIATTEEALAIHIAVASETWRGIAEGYLGQLVLDGEPDRGVELLRASTTRLKGRHEQMRSAFLCTLAEALARTGAFDEAQARLDELFAIVHTSSRVRGTAHAWCAVARVRALQGELDEAREAIGSARAIAEQLGLGGSSRLQNDIDRALRRLGEAEERAVSG